MHVLCTLYHSTAVACWPHPAFTVLGPRTRRVDEAHLDFRGCCCGWQALPINCTTRLSTHNLGDVLYYNSVGKRPFCAGRAEACKPQPTLTSGGPIADCNSRSTNPSRPLPQTTLPLKTERRGERSNAKTVLSDLDCLIQ